MTYYFKTELKEKFLEGRTVVYLLNYVDINYPYLTRILNGKIGCSYRVAKQIVNAIFPDSKVQDFFYEKKKGI